MKIKTFLTTKEELYNVVLPEETISYKPVSHKSIIETILETVDKENIIINSEIYRSSRGGTQVQGDYRFTSNLDKDIDMSMVWQNSYDKTMTLKLASGFYTFVCSNGQVYGDKGSFKKKHVGVIKSLTPSIIKDQISKISEEFQKSVDFKNRMKEIEITKTTCSELVGRLFLEEEIINSTQLSIIKKEFDVPQFDYGVENTAWNLYSNITHSMKESHPRVYIDNQIKLSEFFQTEFA